MSLLKVPISITAISSVSALETKRASIFEVYDNECHFLSRKFVDNEAVWVGQLPKKTKKIILQLRQSDLKYKKLDDSVLYAIQTSRKAVELAGWSSHDNFGVNIGSSRGATTLFENYHQSYLEKGVTETLTSPTTTLGNLSSWVAHDLQTKGPIISHSITCSTALHALLNGAAWIQAGMTDKFLVGGTEAPLTPFTIAQMQALKIYCKRASPEQLVHYNFPCRAFDLKKNQNTMVLGEGAAMACLERGNYKNALAKIIGVGYATEILKHNVSISAEAFCFQDSMQMALGKIAPHEVDVIVMHAPGTVKGDLSEVAAIQKVFGNKIPFLTTNKWKIGHTFGASGMLSIEMAIVMLINQKTIPVPFAQYKASPTTIKKILVNAVGFGGNAVSILLSK